MANKLTDYAMVNVVTGATASGGVLHTVKVLLYTNNIAPTHATQLTDLVEADYNGYARQSVTWLSEFQENDGSISINGDLLQFGPTSTGSSNTIQGAAVVGGVSYTSLVSIEPLASPVTLTTTLDSLLYSPQFSIPANSVYGNGSVVS